MRENTKYLNNNFRIEFIHCKIIFIFSRIFGFVARKPNVSNPDNQCHLFAELEPEQPATAIVNFLNKILSTSGVKSNFV